MTVDEQFCVTKLFFVAMGMMGQNTISSAELEIACEALKRMADQRYDWNDQQRGMYKWLVDYAKETTKKPPQ